MSILQLLTPRRPRAATALARHVAQRRPGNALGPTVEGPLPGRQGQVQRRGGGLLHILPRAKAATADRPEPRRDAEASGLGRLSKICQPGLLGLTIRALGHTQHMVLPSTRAQVTDPPFQHQARHGRASPRLTSRRFKTVQQLTACPGLLGLTLQALGLRCASRTNCRAAHSPKVGCGAAERPGRSH